jgi:hypothetical protein
MSFGWSPSDIYTLVVACYQLVENCRDGLTSASLQIKSLENELTEFTTVLYDLQKVLEATKDIAFIDLKGVKQTIEVCKTYLNKYKSLQQPKPANPGDPSINNNASDKLPKLNRRTSFSKSKELFDKSKETSIKLGQALKYTSWGGDQELQVLQKKFARHRQTLSLYLQILERLVQSNPASYFCSFGHHTNTGLSYAVNGIQKKTPNCKNACTTSRLWSRTYTQKGASLLQ